MGRGQGQMPLVLLLIIIVALGAAFLILYSSGGGEGSGQPKKEEARIELSLDRAEYLEGDAARVSVRDYCGASPSLELDGSHVGLREEAGAFYATVNLSAGEHMLVARDGECAASVGVKVGARQCAEGESAECVTDDGCEGRRQCARGAFGECVRKPLVCRPGSTVGCTLPDGCTMAYRECNRCGTGYGECIGEAEQHHG